MIYLSSELWKGEEGGESFTRITLCTKSKLYNMPVRSMFGIILVRHFRNGVFLSRDVNIPKRFLINSARSNSSVSWESAKPFKDIPSPISLPFIGTAWQMMPIIGRYSIERQNEANREKRKIFGDIIREKLGPIDAVICYTVEDLEVLMKNEGTTPHRIEFSTLKAYREYRKEWFNTSGLLVIQGEEWRHLRTKTQKHLLKPASIMAYLDPLQDVSTDFVKRVFQIRDQNKEIPDMTEELYKWALESVSLVGLDTRLGCLESNLSPDSDAMQMIQSVLTQFECMNKLEAFSGNIQFWRYFTTPMWKKFTKASDIYAKIAFKYINKSLEDIKLKEDSEDLKLTLLQAMLAKKDLSVKDAMVFVADMLMAGIETTSHTVGFLLYHLAKNPEKQELLYQEINRLLPSKDMKLTPTIYDELRYLKACVKESMRLKPVIGGAARTLANDVVLSGYKVPAGAMVFVAYEEIFLSEKNFKNAEKFVPERWLNRQEKPNPFAFVPFGFGPRSCIGKRLALLEINSLAIEILRNFKVEYHYEDIGTYSKMVTTPDKPLRFKFIER
ncbi:probable cytochrome P450 301a1, mitochondrial [Trichonephila clavata]|uniref:Probable cytochrome P450 301a1, mitochondrial n=1 Tax=Trichonephila clavata TaxID=2740835 RepID=A0A8X6KWP3_TRICU|nr:probable cytochrome P450 301a1, mitochondrial [Trichonephila clavata]